MIDYEALWAEYRQGPPLVSAPREKRMKEPGIKHHIRLNDEEKP